MAKLFVTPGALTLAQLRDVYQNPTTLALDESAYAAIDRSVACVENIVSEGRTAYGINTGFGLLASTRIATKTWRTCSARWCSRTRPALAPRSTTRSCA